MLLKMMKGSGDVIGNINEGLKKSAQDFDGITIEVTTTYHQVGDEFIRGDQNVALYDKNSKQIYTDN